MLVVLDLKVDENKLAGCVVSWLQPNKLLVSQNTMLLNN